ncbi:hypothetical protein ACHAWF_011511 [Thalassiosira exigua]
MDPPEPTDDGPQPGPGSATTEAAPAPGAGRTAGGPDPPALGLGVAAVAADRGARPPLEGDGGGTSVELAEGRRPAASGGRRRREVDARDDGGGGGSSSSSSSAPPSLPPPPPREGARDVREREERIDKAASLLSNPEIGDVSEGEKRRYLESKAKMSAGEVDEALERVARGEGPREEDERRRSDRGYGDRFREGGRARRREVGFDERLDLDLDGRRDGRRDRRRRDDPHDHERRRRAPRSPRDPPNYHDDGRTMPPRAPGEEGPPPPPPPPPSSLPALVGGFSLGVVLLAALRWLNGGDFVLVPPPSSAGGGRPAPSAGSAEARASKDAEDEAAEDGTSNEEDEERTDESDSRDQYEEDETDHIMEGDGYDEYDTDMNGHRGLHSIVNGTANAERYHEPGDDDRGDDRPSYDDLVTEIRSLTEAVRSLKDSQERAERAAVAKAGKGTTDDAMDFLRRKKDESRGASNDMLTKSISALLAEVAGDLTALKSNLPKDVSQEDGGDGEDASGQTSREDDACESDTEDAAAKEETDDAPSDGIDGVMEKVRKMQALVASEETKEDGKAVPDETRSEEGESSAGEGDTVAGDSTALASNVPADSGENSEGCDEDPPQSTSEASEATRRTEERLANALRTLKDENDPPALRDGARMLYLYVLNVSRHPSVPRYRKVFTNNETYRKKVGTLSGAGELLEAVGFEERGNCFEWTDGGEGDGGDGSEEATRKDLLDLALAALELMKNEGGK